MAGWMGVLASMPVWVLALAGLVTAMGVGSMLHALAADARDRRARHDFKVHVIRTRNDYVRRLRAIYEGRADEAGDVEFVESDAPVRRAA